MQENSQQVQASFAHLIDQLKSSEPHITFAVKQNGTFYLTIVTSYRAQACQSYDVVDKTVFT